jgi:Asp-tRNA(Asn)/Glu-tRNA(Gln) amidotransferase A subunit family amidase
MPAMTLPAGFTPEGVPVGLEMLTLPHGEPTLFKLGYAFEQATHYRKPSPYAPEL